MSLFVCFKISIHVFVHGKESGPSFREWKVGSLQRAAGNVEDAWTHGGLGAAPGTSAGGCGAMAPRGWGELNLFVFLSQKRQKEKTPHVDVGATQQPPVCVDRFACL